MGPSVLEILRASSENASYPIMDVDPLKKDVFVKNKSTPSNLELKVPSSLKTSTMGHT